MPKLCNIPYRSFFRIIDDSEVVFGPVYLKPHMATINRTHIPVTDEKGEEKYLPRDTEVDVLDKISNFE